jgi:hypothetical protein
MFVIGRRAIGVWLVLGCYYELYHIVSVFKPSIPRRQTIRQRRSSWEGEVFLIGKARAGRKKRGGDRDGRYDEEYRI